MGGSKCDGNKFNGLEGGFGELPSLVPVPGKLVDFWLHMRVKIQYSFWRSKSRLVYLSEFLEGVKEHTENGSSINRLYLAFQKAFDKVLTEYF